MVKIFSLDRILRVQPSGFVAGVLRSPWASPPNMKSGCRMPGSEIALHPAKVECWNVSYRWYLLNVCARTVLLLPLSRTNPLDTILVIDSCFNDTTSFYPITSASRDSNINPFLNPTSADEETTMQRFMQTAVV